MRPAGATVGPALGMVAGWLIRGADVVHGHDAYHPPVILAAALARCLGRPLFLTQHVGIVEHGRAVVRLAQHAVYATAGRMLWHWAAVVTAYNPIVAAFLAARGVPPGRIRLTANGVDTDYFRPGTPDAVAATRRRHGLRPDVPVILFAGRLVPKKGLGALLAARGPEYQLVIAGPGRVPSPAPPGVTFLGPVPRAALRDLYQASDVFACPVSGEMLTLTMQEAMACGVPVVASAHPAYSRYGLDPAGVALVAPTGAALRAEFLGILASPGRAGRMRAYSRRLAVEQFSWQANAAGLASGYLAAAGRPAPARHPGPAPGRRRAPRRRRRAPRLAVPVAIPGAPRAAVAGGDGGGRAGRHGEPARPGCPASVGDLAGPPAGPVHGALLRSCLGAAVAGARPPAGPAQLHHPEPRGAARAVHVPAHHRRRARPADARRIDPGRPGRGLVDGVSEDPAGLRRCTVPGPGLAPRAPGNDRCPAHPGRGAGQVTPPQVRVTTSWDDGHQLDARLAAELAEHGFAGTFYVAPRSAEIPPGRRLSPAALQDLAGRFEIGSHTLTHPRLTRLPRPAAAREISQGKAAVQDIIGREVTSFCYPYGAYRDEHVAAVRAAGFRVARTIRRFCTGPPADPLQLATTTHAARYLADGWPVVRACPTLAAGWAAWRDWDVLSRQLFQQARARGGVYHLWGHSWEIEAHRDWGRLRALLRYIAAHDGVTFVTNGELAPRPGGAPGHLRGGTT